MTVLQIINLIIWLLVLPFCIGLLPTRLVKKNCAQEQRTQEQRTQEQNAQKQNVLTGIKGPGTVLLAGYFVMLPLFWLVTVPAMLAVKYESFLVVIRVFTPIILVLAAAGAGVGFHVVKTGTWSSLFPRVRLKGTGVEEKLLWLIFLGLLVFQLYMAFSLTSFDGDDSEFVARSLIAQQSNVMYTILPYSGGATTLDIRHALAVFPMWTAYIGRMSGVHSTIVSHSILPLVFIPLTYVVYYEIGKCLLRRKKELLPAFLVIVSLLQIFGNVSIYTRETFFLTRTWQGKSLAANLVILSVVWLLLRIYDKEEKGGKAVLWLLLWLVNMTAGVCTSQGAFFCVILIGIVSFFIALYERKFSVLVKAGLVCIPNVAYMFLYLFLH